MKQEILFCTAPTFFSQILYTPLAGTVISQMLIDAGHTPYYYNLNSYFLKRFHPFCLDKIRDNSIAYLQDKEEFMFEKSLSNLIKKRDYSHALISSNFYNSSREANAEKAPLLFAFSFALAKHLKERFDCKIVCGGQIWSSPFQEKILESINSKISKNPIDSIHLKKVTSLSFL